MSLIKWIINNAIFLGGIAAIITIIIFPFALYSYLKQNKNKSFKQKSGKDSTNIQGENIKINVK